MRLNSDHGLVLRLCLVNAAAAGAAFLGHHPRCNGPGTSAPRRRRRRGMRHGGCGRRVAAMDGGEGVGACPWLRPCE